MKICRKEVKESRLWLRLFDAGKNQKLKEEQGELIREAVELTKIFSSIFNKSQ